MKCLFSGQKTTNKEHIIPQWLQRKFNLSNQTFYLPNGTKLPYRDAVIPVSKKHNSNFGKIENNISRNVYKLEEVYLWALKLHLGLIFRDSSLKFDRSSFGSPFILDTENFDSEIKLFRHLYKIWLTNGSTNPTPIGSVFIIDSLYENNEFDFFHCLITGTIGINLGRKFVLVFFWDQRDASHVPVVKTWENHHKPIAQQFSGSPEYQTHIYLAYHAWACETAYFLYRHRRSFNIVASENNFVLVPPLNRAPGKPEDKEEYNMTCRSFGLKLKHYNNNGPHMYEILKIDEIV